MQPRGDEMERRYEATLEELVAAVIDVVDDGPAAAAAPDPTRSGRGLIGMRERAMLFGGDLVAGPRPEGGFAVHARIPLGVNR